MRPTQQGRAGGGGGRSGGRVVPPIQRPTPLRGRPPQAIFFDEIPPVGGGGGGGGRSAPGAGSQPTTRTLPSSASYVAPLMPPPKPKSPVPERATPAAIRAPGSPGASPHKAGGGGGGDWRYHGAALGTGDASAFMFVVAPSRASVSRGFVGELDWAAAPARAQSARITAGVAALFLLASLPYLAPLAPVGSGPLSDMAFVLGFCECGARGRGGERGAGRGV